MSNEEEEPRYTQREWGMLGIMDALFPDEDGSKLIHNLCEADGGATEEQIEQVLQWANLTRFHNMMLDLCLEGSMSIRIVDGDIAVLTRQDDRPLR